MKKSKTKSNEIRYIIKTIGRTLYIIETYDESGSISAERLHRILKDPGFRSYYMSPENYIPIREN